jgi:hypothetical protein
MVPEPSTRGKRGPRPNGQTAKFGLVRISIRPLSSIKPSPENDRLYGRPSPDDLAMIYLADNIREHGLREPIVITRDGFILSGHRRYCACRMLSMKEVRCRVESVWHSDPNFVALLVAYNEQRIKTREEQLREAVVKANPEVAYRDLLEHRQKRAEVTADRIEIVGRKHRARISEAKEPMLQAVIEILEAYRRLWPLTDRGIHYRLLNNPPLRHASKPESRYTNTRQCYQDLCDLLTRARLTGRIPFRAIHDPTRPVEAWNFHKSVSTFLAVEFDNFLDGYRRDLQQSQPNHIEIVGEKNTVHNIIEAVAEEYAIPLTTGRGYSSIPPREAIFKRFEKSGRGRLLMLFLTDHDPEGVDIPHSFARSMRDDFGIENIEPIKVALTYEQTRTMQMPTAFDAETKESSRLRKFVELYGPDAYELEAIEPSVLQSLLRDAIDSVLDVDAFNHELDQEKKDAGYLAGVRETVLETLKSAGVLNPDGDE